MRGRDEGVMRFVKRPVVVEAVQWNPDAQLTRECDDHPSVRPTTYGEVSDLLGTSGCSKKKPYWDWSVMGVIDTLGGKHVVSPGDWIIEGVRGELYPCDPDIFAETYAPAVPEEPRDAV
jgi:hypothetical protein